MPVEVERDQGEVSVKVDFENVTENKQEVVVSVTKEDVVNGISHGDNNGNGNDTDGSYVFISENDTVGDDSLEPDFVLSVDANVVDKDLKEGENMNSEQLKMEATSTAGDDVLGVSLDSQTLEKSEHERAGDGPEEVVGTPKSEIEDSFEKSVELENPGNGHLERGHEGKLESTEEVEQLQDSEAGPRDLTKNNVEEPEGKIESDSKTHVEEHQGDRIEAKDKSDLDVDVSEDLQHSEDVAKHPVDSDQGRESELVSSKVSPAVNDPIGSESVAVLESAPVENGHPIIESELEKIGDVPCTLEKVNASDGDVLPDSGTVKVVVSEVSSDVPAETQTLTAICLESHTSVKDGVVENGNSISESVAIKDLDFVETSEVQSEIGAVDVSVSDGSMNIHPESQDASEPACDEDGKQHIVSEVTDVLNAPASEERSDAVNVSEESVSEAAISDGVPCTNQQESERDEISGRVENLSSHALHEDAPSRNDTTVNLTDGTKSQGSSEDRGVDTNQKIQDDWSAQSEEVTDVNEKHAPIEKVQENNSEGNLNIGGDVCINSAEEAKESSTEDHSENVSHENVETLSTNINGPSSLLDSKTPASELVESSAEGAASDTGAVATKSEAVQSVKECTEPHVVSTTTEDGEINKEVNCGSEMNAMKTTPVIVCKYFPPEEVSEMQGSDIKERSAINSYVEVDSDTKSFDSRKSPLVNNDTVKVGEEEDSREEKNETSGATSSVASESKTCTQDLESKVVTSSDTIHTGVKDGSRVKVVPSSIEGHALDASEGHTVAAEIERRPFYFLPRVPRYDDEKLSEQLKHAEDQVDQKTQSRDALRADIQKIRATCKDYDISNKAAMAEERSARKAMHSKRQEIEALQSVISRVKSAASVDDIDSRVRNMEHIIQHETISLREEKGFIREIKQLKQLREQISSSMGTKDEVKQALEKQEKTEERLKVLRKELDMLRNDLSKAEAVTKAAKKSVMRNGKYRVNCKNSSELLMLFARKHLRTYRI